MARARSITFNGPHHVYVYARDHSPPTTQLDVCHWQSVRQLLRVPGFQCVILLAESCNIRAIHSKRKTNYLDHQPMMISRSSRDVAQLVPSLVIQHQSMWWQLGASGSSELRKRDAWNLTGGSKCQDAMRGIRYTARLEAGPQRGSEPLKIAVGRDIP